MCVYWRSNSGLHACAACHLPTEPSLQPHCSGQTDRDRQVDVMSDRMSVCLAVRVWGDREPDLFPLCFLQHFSELLDEFSQNVLGQLLSDPFLSEKSESMEVEPSPTSPAPLIQAEHSYSLSEEPRTQSPFTHAATSDSFNDGKKAESKETLGASNLLTLAP